jgi:hypothetical protein
MSKRKPAPCIRLRGVRHNNLKGFNLDLPLNRLIVITGLSGSGKSSLAFDTLYAEGQRRYIETFSPYTRQFFDRMDKPRVDSIDGIPPAIAIEQRNTVKTTRSTVGTMTEICEHMKQAWPLVATLYCRQCGRTVAKESPQRIWAEVANETGFHGDLTRGGLESEGPPSPLFSMDAQGSLLGSESPIWSSSIEISSGERTKAMWPSRGGRRMVTPFSCKREQVA